MRVITKMVARRVVMEVKKIAFMGNIRNPACRKRALENRHITKMLAYSAIKIKANLPALYSVLNPETSSLSPSAKSKGARLVSATQVKSHVSATGPIIKVIGRYGVDSDVKKSKDHRASRAANKRRDIDTS